MIGGGERLVWITVCLQQQDFVSEHIMNWSVAHIEA